MFSFIKYRFATKSFQLLSKVLLQRNVNGKGGFDFCRKHFVSNNTHKGKTLRKTALIGIGGLTVVGTVIATRRFAETKADSSEFPQITPSKSVMFPDDDSGLKLTLFQYQTCPFCCKVRAFLNYYGISYNIVEVNPVLRNEIKFSSWKKVPILLVEDRNGKHQLNDSSMIISSLRSFFLDKKQQIDNIVKSYPVTTFTDEDGNQKTEVVNRYFVMFGELPMYASKEELERERKWRKWVDDVLVHMLSPNIYRDLREALQAFQWFSEVGEWEKHFAAWERYLIIYVGSIAMYFIGKRLKKRHGLKEDVRESLYHECRRWLKEVGNETPFHGGTKPNLADLAVFGVFNAIEGCESFQDLQKNTNITPWYNRMKREVEIHLDRHDTGNH